jgi:hypothetical protein
MIIRGAIILAEPISCREAQAIVRALDVSLADVAGPLLGESRFTVSGDGISDIPFSVMLMALSPGCRWVGWNAELRTTNMGRLMPGDYVSTQSSRFCAKSLSENTVLRIQLKRITSIS